MTIEKARELVKKYLKDIKNQMHSRESEEVLRALAQELAQDKETWALTGLLHDLDWEVTDKNSKQHGIKTLELLKKEGYNVQKEVVHAISAHNEEHTGVKRQTQLDYALAAGESVTGLIYAYALMRPDKLAGMKASSLNKKFKDKSFAANVSRKMIADIEKAGIAKKRFFEIAIGAMQGISNEIGL